MIYLDPTLNLKPRFVVVECRGFTILRGGRRQPAPELVTFYVCDMGDRAKVIALKNAAKPTSYWVKKARDAAQYVADNLNEGYERRFADAG